MISLELTAFIGLIALLTVFAVLSEKWRPLAVALLLSLISLPLYVLISQLPLGSVERILLQLAVFTVILFLFFYVIAFHYSKLRGKPAKGGITA